MPRVMSQFQTATDRCGDVALSRAGPKPLTDEGRPFMANAAELLVLSCGLLVPLSPASVRWERPGVRNPARSPLPLPRAAWRCAGVGVRAGVLGRGGHPSPSAVPACHGVGGPPPAVVWGSSGRVRLCSALCGAPGAVRVVCLSGAWNRVVVSLPCHPSVRSPGCAAAASSLVCAAWCAGASGGSRW